MKIYISATYRDLQKHRLAVSTVLRRMGHEAIGMEDYVAEGVRPLHRCLADVSMCDLFVGIVAWRYGYVPLESSADPNTLPSGTVLGKTSVTEFEFRSALQSGKPILMFLLDADAEWPVSQLDALSSDGELGKAVAGWRQEIEQNYLVAYFRTPEELASLVGAAVYRAEMSRQVVLESLRLESPQNENQIRDSSLGDSGLITIETVIAEQQGTQALRINIGDGSDWWMTRLYFLAALAAELTEVRVLVFVSKSEAFIGIVDPEIVKERLTKYYPVLKEYEDALVQSGPPSPDLRTEVNRRLNCWRSSLTGTGGEGNLTVFVSKSALEAWLSPYVITQAIDWDARTNAALHLQRLLDWPMRFVPVVESGKFSRVVDKVSLAEQVARLFVREQVARALSMTR